MSVLEKLNISKIKYYGITDLSNYILINEFNKNKIFILESIKEYKSYEELLNSDFVLGFYILNLFFLYNDFIKNKIDFNDEQINLSKNVFVTNFEDLKLNLNLENKKILKNFKSWTLLNLRNIFQNNDKIKFSKERYIVYNDILEIIIKYFEFKDNESDNLISLFKKNIFLLLKLIKEGSIKNKQKLDNYFMETMQEEFKNKNFEMGDIWNLIDYHIELVNKKMQKEKELKKIYFQEIILYCKFKIEENLANNSISTITSIEIFENLIIKYKLNKVDDEILLWINKKQVEANNLIQWDKKEVSFKIDDKEWNCNVDKLKNLIYSNYAQPFFYNLKEKTSFSYYNGNNNDWINYFLDNTGGEYGSLNELRINDAQSLKLKLFFDICRDKKAFEKYSSELATVLESVLYDLKISEEENIFCLERYYEIIYQTQDVIKNIDIITKQKSLYMKNMTLIFSEIENIIRFFINKLEKNILNKNIDYEEIKFSTFIGEAKIEDIKKGSKFVSSKYIENILSANAKKILYYYLYCPIKFGGLEIRNKVVHGNFKSNIFLNFHFFMTTTTLFFQLIEELTWNYYLSRIKIIEPVLNEFLAKEKEFNFSFTEKNGKRKINQESIKYIVDFLKLREIDVEESSFYLKYLPEESDLLEVYFLGKKILKFNKNKKSNY